MTHRLAHQQRSTQLCRVGSFRLLLLSLIAALVLAACAAPAGPAATDSAETAAEEEVADTTAADESADAYTTIYGEQLPEDAAPYDEQILRIPCDNTANHITFDFVVAVYQRFCAADLFQDQLVVLDKDFNVIPASAESWEVSEDGLTWTFTIKEGLQWSDGTPLTAHDWVATFQYAADPEHAWDFSWFYSGVLENWDEIIAGELPVEELGVTAVDDLTLQITTETPWPPLPGMMVFSFVMQKQAMEEHGPLYNSDPATSVSAGPFILESLEPGERIVLSANPMYTGYRQPRLQQVVMEYMNMATGFAAFQNGDIDRLGYEWLSPADFQIILSDETLSENYLRHYGDFRTDYLLFDTFSEPFNDINVRKAFAHAVDREAIVTNVYGEIKAMPAHSMLMPGYPAADVEGELVDYQVYDCARAQEYLAEAGYPDGEGFPAMEMWLRNEGPAMAAVYQATAASIAECLNIDIQVANQDFKVYMDALNAKPTQLQLGAVSYGMDFLDPANLLGIWLSTGRHSWLNEEFDTLVQEASSMVGDPETRLNMFKEAEEILVDDVGGVFIAYRWQGDLFQPYVQGSGIREPDSQGIAAWHWGNDWVWGDVYIADE